MKILEKKIKKLISVALKESRIKLDYSSFKNLPPDEITFKSIERYNNAVDSKQKAKMIIELLQPYVYRSLQGTPMKDTMLGKRDMLSKLISKPQVLRQIDSIYFKASVNPTVNFIVSNLGKQYESNIRISSSAEKGFRQFNFYNKAGHTERGLSLTTTSDPTAKVYYTIKFLNQQGTAIKTEMFLELQKIYKNFGNICCHLINNPTKNIDMLSFKFNENFKDFLAKTDDVVVYCDNQSEAVLIKDFIDKNIVSRLNSQLKYFNLMSSSERTGSLGRVSIGYDPRYKDTFTKRTEKTSDTAALSFFVLGRIIGQNFPNVHRFVVGNSHNGETQAFIDGLMNIIEDNLEPVLQEWQSSSGIERQQKLQKVRLFLGL